MNALKKLWCQIFHNEVYWPAHGRYVCKTCLTEFEAPMELKQVRYDAPMELRQVSDQVNLTEEVGV